MDKVLGEHHYQEKKIPLMEIFGPTIQGEGSVIGQSTYFMRFGLCDYRCKMCDSMFAVDVQSVRARAEFLTQDEIYVKFLQQVKQHTKWITLSGGNPLIHNLEHLTSMLAYTNWLIAVETQGTIFQEWLLNVQTVTISPKGPGMGEECDFETLNAFVDKCIEHLIHFTFKIVIFDQRDLQFAIEVYEHFKNRVDINDFYLSLGNPLPPLVSGESPEITPIEHQQLLLKQYKMLYSDILNNENLAQMKFLPQWHVFLWGNDKGH